MEFILQALTYPEIKQDHLHLGRGDASKAISDLQAYIAQKVDVIVVFADAGTALLPTVKEAKRGRHPGRAAQRHRSRRQAAARIT